MQDLKKIFAKKTDKDDEIQKYLRMIQNSDQPLPDAHFKLGRLYQQVNQKAAALKQYELAAKRYLETGQITGALVSNKIIAVLNPEDRDSLANIAHIEFQESRKLTEEMFRAFLEEHGENVPMRGAAAKPAKNAASQQETAPAKGKSRAAFEKTRGQKEETSAPQNAQFQLARQSLVNLISGGDDEQDDSAFRAERREFLDLLNEKSPTPEVAASVPQPAAPLEDEGEFIDLTEQVGEAVAPPSVPVAPAAAVPTSETLMAQLRQCAFLTPLSDDELRRLIQNSAVHAYDEDETIMRYPSQQDALFVVLTEEVYLVKPQGQCANSSVIQVSAGECWGEQRFFPQMRTCAFSVMGTLGASALEIPREQIASLTSAHPDLLAQLRRICEQRWAATPLSVFPLFGELSLQEQQQLMPLFSEIACQKGDVIIREGDTGVSMYLITSGEVEVYSTLLEEGEIPIVQTDKARLFLAKLQTGDCFGEGAFFTHEPRSATIQAITDVKLLKLPEEHLHHMLRDFPAIAQKLEQCHQQRVQKTMTLLQSAF